MTCIKVPDELSIDGADLIDDCFGRMRVGVGSMRVRAASS